jgi:hypothetical protein
VAKGENMNLPKERTYMNSKRKTRWMVIQRDADRQIGALHPRSITDDRYSIVDSSIVENRKQ